MSGARGVEVEPYARAWRARLAGERLEWARRADEARELARLAADRLVGDFGVARVYLFGSLTGHTSAPFGAGSDVDLAVEGLPPARYLEAGGAIEDTFGGLTVDLVRVEDASGSLRRRILADGLVLRG